MQRSLIQIAHVYSVLNRVKNLVDPALGRGLEDAQNSLQKAGYRLIDLSIEKGCVKCGLLRNHQISAIGTESGDGTVIGLTANDA